MAIQEIVTKVGVGARWIVGIVFVFAAVGKIVEPELFARSILRYQLVPVSGVNLLAIFLPWIELFVGMALLLGIRTKAAALMAGGLLIVFTIAIASAWARGLNIECGCFTQSAAASAVSLQKIAENVGLIVAAAVAYLTVPKPQQAE